MYAYPVEFSADDSAILVTFPDVPEAVTFGENEADARVRAVDALETAFIGYLADRRELPIASAANGRLTISPSLLAAMKLRVYEAMREKNWRKADLARATGQNPRQIDRLLDLRHGSTVDQMEHALAACGMRATIEIRELKAA